MFINKSLNSDKTFIKNLRVACLHRADWQCLKIGMSDDVFALWFPVYANIVWQRL